MRTLPVKAFLLGLVICASPEQALGDSSTDIMHEIMRERAQTNCRDLGQVFILSQTGFRDPKVRVLATSCYTAKSRLHLFGKPQELIMSGTRVHELPIRIIAEKTGLNLDPYKPLSGAWLSE